MFRPDTKVFYVVNDWIFSLLKAGKIFPSFLVLLLSFQAVQAANINWVGATSSDWNTAGNWSSGTVPANGDVITIGPISSGNNAPTAGNLEMGQWNKPSSLTITDGAELTVTGNITVVANASIQITDGGSLKHTGTGATSFPGYGSASLSIVDGHFSTEANFTFNTNFSIGTGSFTVNGNLDIASGKSFTATNARITVNGNVTLNNSGSSFHAGNDSLIINGQLDTWNNTFYGDSAVVIINGDGTNNITGNFYTNAAQITFNPVSLTEIKSGGRFYVNSGKVYFADSVRVGNNGKLFANSGTVTFSKSILVSANGELDAGSGTMNFEGNATFSNNGTMNAGSAEVNFGGNVTINNSGGTINAETSTLTISGDISNAGSFNAGTSTVVLAGDSTQTISNDIVFYNLNVETSGTVAASGNITVLNTGIIGSSSEISMPDPDDQFNVQGDLVDSSGTVGVNTNKPFVTSIEVNSSTEIVVVFNETVSVSSAENASNSSWTGRTISSRTRIDSNRLRLIFTPAISLNVEYTLTFQNIENTRSPVGTMSAGHTKKFTWTPPAAPTTPASNLAISGSSDTSITLTWTNGNGASRIVFARQGTQLSQVPTNGTTYMDSSFFGEGDALGSNTYVVYQGTGSNVSVNGLENNRQYSFTVYEFNGSGSLSSYLTSSAPSLTTNTHVKLEIKVFLEGPDAGGYMSTSLGTHIPDTQVYNTSPWNYNGTENVSTMPNDSIVDWVLVELRQAPLPNQATDTTIVGRRAGFLLSNGQIVDLDGVSPLLIQTSRSGKMFVVIYHRSHVPIQSSDSIVRGNNKFIYDFTSSGTKAYGSNSPLKQLNNGQYGMYCGRISSNSINESDRTDVWNARNSSGYQAMDVNMDGVVDASDRAQIWNNRGVEAGVVD